PTYVGGPFFISERVDGESVPRRVLRIVHQQGIGELVAGQLGQALARLHAIDPAQAPAELAGDAGSNPTQVALTEADAGVTQLLPNRPVFALGLRWLERRLPNRPARQTIVHTDARNGNLIVGPDGLRAVLDWEGARRFGDAMQDLAWPALRMWRC